MTEQEQLEFDLAFEKIHDTFPNINFVLPFDEVEQLDALISEEREIIIKQDFKCYCYDKKFGGKPRKPKTIKIKCENMTYKNVILELVKKKFVVRCGHYFLEEFYEDTDGTYLLRFGS